MANDKDGSRVGSMAAIIAVLAGAALAGYGVFTGLGELFADDQVAAWIKVLTAIAVGGLIVSACAVIANRVREARHENLKDVEL